MCFILFINVNRWDYELAILLLACAEHVATVHCSIQCRLISIFSQLQPGVFGFGYYSIFICMRLFTGSFRRTLAFVETWKENPPSAFSFDSLFIAVFVGRMKTDANMSAAWTVRRWKTQYQWNESDQLIQFHRPVQPCSIQFALLFLTNSIANKLVGGGFFLSVFLLLGEFKRERHLTFTRYTSGYIFLFFFLPSFATNLLCKWILRIQKFPRLVKQQKQTITATVWKLKLNMEIVGIEMNWLRFRDWITIYWKWIDINSSRSNKNIASSHQDQFETAVLYYIQCNIYI